MSPFIRMTALFLCTTIVPVFAAAAATYEDRYLDANGVKIRYIDTGKGPAIVLLHGGTSRLESWVTPGVVDNLAKDFRVIAFDARGHGKSDSPREPSAYGRQQALDVVRILDALKIDRAHIIGFSLGSSTVAQLLTLHPERFLTGVQVAGAGRTPEEANDPRIETEASEIARDCISRSRLKKSRNGSRRAARTKRSTSLPRRRHCVVTAIRRSPPNRWRRSKCRPWASWAHWITRSRPCRNSRRSARA